MDDAFHTGVLIAASIALRPRAAPARRCAAHRCVRRRGPTKADAKRLSRASGSAASRDVRPA
jgi:hypothetical protein